MGRKPSKHSNLPPHMRKRVRGEKVYYFLDTGGKPRKEIPLGTDYILALKRYAELNETSGDAPATFDDVIKKYELDVLPTLARNTIKTHTSDMKHLRKSFSSAPLDQIRPMHIHNFLEDHRNKPTTANRCKRLFSTLWNHARAWGYTDLPNPCAGIMGHAIQKKTAYVTDQVFNIVREHASDALKDALDLAYFTGQRPADTLKMRGADIANGYLEISQGKTKKRLRILVTGALAELLGRIAVRKAQHKIVHDQLLMNREGKPFTQPTLRSHFDAARAAAKKKHPALAAQIDAFKFRDLRAKAADDTSDQRGEQAASDLLGHDNVKTTQRHYLRRGKIVEPTK
jgi:integrase